MTTADEHALKTVELVGRIAVLSELQKWGDIRDLLNHYALDAYKAGMTEAANIPIEYASQMSTSTRSPSSAAIKNLILAARDNKTTL